MTRFIYSFYLFFLLYSCTNSSQEAFNQNFNYPLQKEIEHFPIEDYKAYNAINNKYLKIAEEKGYNDGKAHCYINTASDEINKGNFIPATELLQKAEVILIQSDNNALKAYFYNTLAFLNYRVNITDHFALAYNNKALYYMKKCNPEEQKMYQMDKIYQVRAYFLATTLKTDSAAIYFHKALNNSSTALNKVNTLASLAEMQLVSNKLDSAATYVEKTLNTVKDVKGDKEIQAYAYYIAARYYTAMKQFSNAEMLLNKALNINNSISSIHLTPFLYDSLYNFYKEKGDKQKEIYYSELSQKARDQMFNNRSIGINTVNRKLIADTKQQEHQELSNTRILIGLLMVVVIIAGIFIYLWTRKLKVNKMALKTEAEILKDKLEDKSGEELIKLAQKNDSYFLAKFKEVYPQFVLKLLEINPNLENTEIVFCAMLKLHFSSKEIAQNLVIQHASVQKRKNRIRKKLGISSNVDIYDYFDQMS
ncbi:helix-turn-helix transcriptional regulator [Chryseobacterium sp. c4a]|uniref:helix-turn-helix transcriptional regulator n=1 Tax=Chryseobacterium sp. c4a TaxID=1573582 RepID=UPI00135B1034|nr:hypothetical protein [Chryseobacterium sp. c4a]